MSQPPPPITPPPLAYGLYPPQQRTNGPAIASLVCGIVGCIPFLTSLAAIILGVIGLRKARSPDVGGKSLAIVGLVLGIVGMVGWGLFGGLMVSSYVASKPARAVANQFALDLSNGNINAAVAASSGMTSEQLSGVAQQMQPWGALTDTTFMGFNTRFNLNSATICELNGTATFATGGQKVYTVTLIKQGQSFKVQSFNFR